jgi:hypothetical protein
MVLVALRRIPKRLGIHDATFAAADLTARCRLDEVGLEVVGRRLEPDRAVIARRVVTSDEWCD